MIAVHRYSFKLNNLTDTTSINIPIILNSYPVDQCDIIERDFVDKEIEEAINPIIDYGSTRFYPVNSNDDQTQKITYNLVFNSGNNYNNIGFELDDLRFNRNNFKYSYLQLDFYDSNKLTNQNFLYTSSLYCRVTSDMFDQYGKLKLLPQISIKFDLENPITKPSGISEGYYIYDYKSEVLEGLPKEVFMRATFNNAKTGISHKFTTINSPQKINEISESLHIKYTLIKDNNGYHYKIGNGITNIILYELKII